MLTDMNDERNSAASQALSRLLLVDEETVFLTALTSTITLGIPWAQVDLSHSAPAALLLVETQRYDVIVCNVTLLNLAEYPLLKAIHYQQADAVLLFLLDQGEQDQNKQVLQAVYDGAYDVMQKPVDHQHFLATLHCALQNQQWYRQMIEQQRKFEQQLYLQESVMQSRMQELTEAYEAKDKIIGLLAQELAVPIAHLKAVMQLLQQKMVGPGSSKDTFGADVIRIIAQSFTDMHEVIHHAEALVNDLGNTSHIDARLLIPHKNMCDLVVLCQHILLEIITPSRLTVHWQCAHGPIDVNIDYEQIEQALRLLLTHIVGQPLQNIPVKIILQQTSHEAIIALHDLQAYPYLGIDFYIARKIIEHHDGHLEIQSFPGDQQTIFISLPCSPSEPQTTSASSFPRVHAIGTLVPSA